MTGNLAANHNRVRAGRMGAVCIAASLVLAACASKHYAERADREVYRIVEEKSPAVPGMEPAFSINQNQESELLAGLPVLEESNPALGADAQVELGARIVSLEHALRLAVTNSRAYQNRKEGLYLEALALTLDRHHYTPIFSGGVEAGHNWTATDLTRNTDLTNFVNSATGLSAALEDLTGTPATLLNAYATLVDSAADTAGLDPTETQVLRERSADGRTSIGVNMLMKGGAEIALNLTSNFFRFLAGDPRTATSSVLTGSLTQPLLRGAGREVNTELLTQAERDVLYELREFTNFRKEFAVQVASEYYNVLLQRDVVRNNWDSYNNFKTNLERERAFASEGRRTLSEIGRLEQALLNTENQWIDAARRYKESLDSFKITLGLPTDAQIVLDEAELVKLIQEGLIHPEITAEDAITVASAARLDLQTQRDRVVDAERRVRVAANALKPGLDLLLTGAASSSGADNFQNLDFERADFSAGMDLDLPLDRKAERNAYRAALITHERALRDYTLEEDTIKLELRSAVRDLERARRNFELAQQSVALNERRVLEQNLLAELGRATALDQVDAQNDLTQAQNDLVSALVNHTVTRLGFWRDMGILYIKPNGQWELLDSDTPAVISENGDV